MNKKANFENKELTVGELVRTMEKMHDRGFKMHLRGGMDRIRLGSEYDERGI